jgi:hypothetical protein
MDDDGDDRHAPKLGLILRGVILVALIAYALWILVSAF